MATDRVDEESARIVNCINNCWPEYSFTYNDLRKPTGEKFRDVLLKFLKGILGVNYQLSSVNMHDFSRNPEMYSHMEGTLSLFRDISKLLKSIHNHNLRYTDLFRPAPAIVKDVLLSLTNFLAYFESEEAHKEEIEEEVERMKNTAIQSEKRLVEEERYLDKCKQSDEEKKMMGAELREMLLKRKENYLITEKSVSKLGLELDDLSKKLANINLRLEEGFSSLKQLESEKEKAAEAVVPDPDALEAELSKSRNDKEIMDANLTCLKSRLPILEQQIADRTTQLQERKETHQRLAQVKTRENKIKAELHRAENECMRVEEEKTTLANQLKKDINLIESKKRMLEEYNNKLEQLRGSLEKARSDLKHCVTEEDSRKAQQESRLFALENEIAQLKQDLKLVAKALEEGAAVFEAMNVKHQRDVQQLYSNWEGHFIETQNLLNAAFPG